MSLGSLIGLIFTPYLIDWRGRKIGVAIGCAIMLLAVALQTGGTNSFTPVWAESLTCDSSEHWNVHCR
jgi:MFS family permease